MLWSVHVFKTAAKMIELYKHYKDSHPYNTLSLYTSIHLLINCVISVRANVGQYTKPLRPRCPKNFLVYSQYYVGIFYTEPVSNATTLGG